MATLTTTNALPRRIRIVLQIQQPAFASLSSAQAASPTETLTLWPRTARFATTLLTVFSRSRYTPPVMIGSLFQSRLRLSPIRAVDPATGPNGDLAPFAAARFKFPTWCTIGAPLIVAPTARTSRARTTFPGPPSSDRSRRTGAWQDSGPKPSVPPPFVHRGAVRPGFPPADFPQGTPNSFSASSVHPQLSRPWALPGEYSVNCLLKLCYANLIEISHSQRLPGGTYCPNEASPDC